MRQCPNCGSPRVHRSRSRGLLEQIRKMVSSQRLHRCHACGWRGWGLETEHPAAPDLPGVIKPSLDLKVIDAVVLGGKGGPEKSPEERRRRRGRGGESKSL